MHNSNESLKLKIKNLYANAYERKIFKGKIITFKQNKITYKQNIDFDIFFTKNPNNSFCSMTDNKSTSYLRSWTEEKELEINYNLTTVYLNIINPNDESGNSLREIPLVREDTFINHGHIQNVLEGRSFINFNDSDLKDKKSFLTLEDLFFLLEIRIKKPDKSISINDKEDLKEVHFIAMEHIKDIIELFSTCKYLVYYERDAIKNYISKYVYDLVNLFIKMSDTSLNFFEEIGIVNKKTEKIFYPLKDSVKKIRNLNYQGILITYFKSDNRDIFSFIEKFSVDKRKKKQFKLHLDYSRYLKYKVRMEDERYFKQIFKTKRNFQKIFAEEKPNSSSGSLNIELIEREINKETDRNIFGKNNKTKDSILHFLEKYPMEEYEFLKDFKFEYDGRIVVSSIFTYFFKILNKSFINCEENKNDKNYFENEENQNNQNADKNSIDPMSEMFFLNYLKNGIIKYVTYKGFFNIDIILNEDEFKNFDRWIPCKCNPLKNFANKVIYKAFDCILSGLNTLMDVNEGLIHKHFAVLSNSYNFNQKNRIFTFNSKFDSSKKNNLRIYDIFFHEKWAEKIALLIIEIFKEFYGMGKNEENYEKDSENYFDKNSNGEQKINNNSSENRYKNFLEKFKETINFITEELFENYGNVLPDYKSFCNALGRFPISRYNIIDNLCQHFTNSSVQTMLNRSIMFYQNINEIKEINKNLKDFYIFPNLNAPIEPFLIAIDKTLKTYLTKNIEFDDFLKKKFKNDLQYIKRIKLLNEKNTFLHNLIYERKNSPIEKIQEILKEKYKTIVKHKCKFNKIFNFSNKNFK